MSETETTTRPASTPFSPSYDVTTNPELFDGVMGKRVIAFILDAIIVLVLTAVVALVVTIFTLGIGLFFLPLVFYGTGLAYNALTVGGPSQSTIGMRLIGLRVRMWHGGNVMPLIAAFHAFLFWLSLTIFFPILLWPFIDRQRRCLHDIFAGVVVVRQN